MNIKTLFLAIAVTTSCSALYGQTITQQSALVEQTIFENKQNNLPKYTGIETNYLVKVGGLEKYDSNDLEALSIKMETIKVFKDVSITDNNASSLISILTNGNITADQIKTELINQGFNVFDIVGEMQLTNSK